MPARREAVPRGRLMIHGESDHLRGLGGRESRPQGAGVTVRRRPHRKLGPDRQGRRPQANLPEE